VDGSLKDRLEALEQMATSIKSTQQGGTRVARNRRITQRVYENPPPHLRPRQPPIGGVSQETLNGLTPKQQAFVREYLVDLNGAAAARRAGYSENSAKQIASENLTKLDVMMAIEEAFAALGGITRIRIVDELGAIAFSDIGEIVDWSNETQQVASDLKKRIEADIKNGSKPGEEAVVLTNRVVLKPSHKLTREQRRAVAKVAQDRYGNVRIAMNDKIAALKVLGQALGMFKEQLDVTSAGAAVLPAVIHYYGRPEPQRKGSEPAGRPSGSRAVKPARDKGS
jgi:phage terminase small subunit